MYEQVGAPLWLYRDGMNLPGTYTAFAQEQPHDYTGSVRSSCRLCPVHGMLLLARSSRLTPILPASSMRLCQG